MHLMNPLMIPLLTKWNVSWITEQLYGSCWLSHCRPKVILINRPLSLWAQKVNCRILTSALFCPTVTSMKLEKSIGKFTYFIHYLKLKKQLTWNDRIWDLNDKWYINVNVRGNGLKLIRLFIFRMCTMHIQHGEETDKKKSYY